MDPPEFPSGDRPSPTRRELQGPRPSPLRVRKDSYKIKKPPVPPHPHHHHLPPPPPPHTAATTTQRTQPVIIYSVSPKVIHTTPSDYKDLVQRLTGISSDSGSGDPGGGDVSPAARMASIERTSPKERERAGDLMMGSVEDVVEVGQIPGILSPAPASLAPIPSGFFSPAASDPHGYYLLNDLSPFLYGNMFIPSPSALLSSTPMLSPSPSSSFDVFNLFS